MSELITINSMSEIDWSLAPKGTKAAAADKYGEIFFSASVNNQLLIEFNCFSVRDGIYFEDGFFWKKSPYRLADDVDWRTTLTLRPETNEQQPVEVNVRQVWQWTGDDFCLKYGRLLISDFTIIKIIIDKFDLDDSLAFYLYDGSNIKCNANVKEIKEHARLIKDAPIEQSNNQPAQQATPEPVPGQLGWFSSSGEKTEISILKDIFDDHFTGLNWKKWDKFKPMSSALIFALLQKAPDFTEWEKAYKAKLQSSDNKLKLISGKVFVDGVELYKKDEDNQVLNDNMQPGDQITSDDNQAGAANIIIGDKPKVITTARKLLADDSFPGDRYK